MSSIDPEDIVGKKFNKLTVIKYVGIEKKRHSSVHKYLCQCECGNTKIVNRGNLKNGHAYSCGCVRKNFNHNDIVGKHFGDWLVLEWAGRRHGNQYYRCRCECGAIQEVDRRYLLNGSSTSCGHEKNWNRPTGSGLDFPYDIIGEVMNDLTCIKCLGRDSNRNWIYLCRCRCGNEVKIDRGNFLLGTYKNCGRCPDQV